MERWIDLAIQIMWKGFFITVILYLASQIGGMKIEIARLKMIVRTHTETLLGEGGPQTRKSDEKRQS